MCYTVRESKRAKRVILKVSPRNGLEVVVPRGFNRALLPEILDAKRDWIGAQLGKLRPAAPLVPPQQITLSAIGESWSVQYQPTASARLSVSEPQPSVLVVVGDTAHVSTVSQALVGWLHRRAQQRLVPWLRRVSDEVGIAFQKATVRGQATRWASCSQAHNISLNRTLLFLPPHLVRQVFLHELAHVRQPNHLPRFWAEVEKLEPQYKKREAEVRRADHYVPPWATRRQ